MIALHIAYSETITKVRVIAVVYLETTTSVLSVLRNYNGRTQKLQREYPSYPLNIQKNGAS